MTLNSDERLVVRIALVHERERLLQFIADCNAIPAAQRRYPTDQPEHWAADLKCVETLLERFEAPR